MLPSATPNLQNAAVAATAARGTVPTLKALFESTGKQTRSVSLDQRAPIIHNLLPTAGRPSKPADLTPEFLQRQLQDLLQLDPENPPTALVTIPGSVHNQSRIDGHRGIFRTLGVYTGMRKFTSDHPAYQALVQAARDQGLIPPNAGEPGGPNFPVIWLVQLNIPTSIQATEELLNSASNGAQAN